MRIAVVNDVHVGPEKPYCGVVRKLSGRADAELAEFLSAVRRTADIDAVVQLGDLIEDDSYQLDASRYRQALSRFDGMPLPAYHVIGNHEQVHLGEEDLRAWLGYPRLFYSFSLAGYRCIVLFSEHRPGVLPRIGIAQLEWLRLTLQAASQPVLVFVHHPMDDQALDGNPWFERNERQCLISNRTEVRGVLEASGRVLAVVSAHAHWHYLSEINGIHYITLQSLVERVGEGVPARSWSLLTFENGTMRLQVFGEQPEDRTLSLTDSDCYAARK